MIICDQILTGNQYARCYTGKYFVHCDTVNEVRGAIRSVGISTINGIKLSENSEINYLDKNFVLVEFSKEDDYTEHEYRWMTVQKKHLKGFVKRLNEEGISPSSSMQNWYPWCRKKTA